VSSIPYDSAAFRRDRQQATAAKSARTQLPGRYQKPCGIGCCVGFGVGSRVGNRRRIAGAVPLCGQQALERRVALVVVGAGLAFVARRNAAAVEPFDSGRQLVGAKQPTGAIVGHPAELARSGGFVRAGAALCRSAVDLGFVADEITAAVGVGSAAITRRAAGGEEQTARDESDQGGRENRTRTPHR
jgi:hypothetical protein